MYEQVSPVVLKVRLFEKVAEAISRVYQIRDCNLIVVSVKLSPELRSDKPVARTGEPPKDQIECLKVVILRKYLVIPGCIDKKLLLIVS